MSRMELSGKAMKDNDTKKRPGNRARTNKWSDSGNHSSVHLLKTKLKGHRRRGGGTLSIRR